jgi:hypothetical protein
MQQFGKCIAVSLYNLNGTYQLLKYADDMNLLGKNTHMKKKNTEV